MIKFAAFLFIILTSFIWVPIVILIAVAAPWLALLVLVVIVLHFVTRSLTKKAVQVATEALKREDLDPAARVALEQYLKGNKK